MAFSGVGLLGNEAEYFGLLTKQVLVRFQSVKEISPAIGYFESIVLVLFCVALR